MKLLVLTCLTGLFLICTFTNAIFAEPVAIWLFEEDSGDVVSDSSGNNNNGEIVGKAEWVEGKFGKALSLPGTMGNYVTIPDSPTLNPIEQITMMMWIKLDHLSFAGFPRPFSKDLCCEEAKREYGIQLKSNGSFDLIIQPGPKNVLAFSKPVLSPGEWQHIAGTFESKTRTVIVYYNTEDVTASVTDAGGGLIDGPSPLLLCYYSDAVNFFEGEVEIDDAAIFDTALDADEIAKIYRVGLQQAVLAVSTSGKLAVTWGDVKNKY